jgi:hypothetical protein
MAFMDQCCKDCDEKGTGVAGAFVLFLFAHHGHISRGFHLQPTIWPVDDWAQYTHQNALAHWGIPLPASSAWLSGRVLHNPLCRLLGNHQCRRVGVATGDQRHHTGINHSKTGNQAAVSAHPQA